MDLTEQRRKVRFDLFKRRCQDHEENGTWPSEFSRALCFALVTSGFGPAELARRTGRHYQHIAAWVRGKYSPRKKTARSLERALDLRPGELVNFAGKSEEVARALMKKRWDTRRKKAGTLQARKKLFVRGDYHGGYPPLENLNRSGGSNTRLSVQARLRISLARMCRQTNGRFVECRGCHKALYRSNYLVDRGDTHWHDDCWLLSSRGTPKTFRPPRKPGADTITRIVYTLRSDGLRETARQIYENSAHGSTDIGLGIKSIENRIKSGRQDLEGLRWKELVPSKGKDQGNINRALGNFPVREVLQIARGEHPLSIEGDIETIRKWFPGAKALDPLRGFCVADTHLAQLVGESIKQRFPTVRTAARSSGLSHDTLKSVLLNRWRSPHSRTWIAISALTGKSVELLRKINEVSSPGFK